MGTLLGSVRWGQFESKLTFLLLGPTGSKERNGIVSEKRMMIMYTSCMFSLAEGW